MKSRDEVTWKKTMGEKSVEKNVGNSLSQA